VLRYFKLHVLFWVLLGLSILGGYTASQIDAPYGFDVGLEAVVESISGWLMIYGAFLVWVYRDKWLGLPGSLLIITGVIVAALDYRWYVELYSGYASNMPSRAEFIANTPVIFALSVLLSVLAVGYLFK
jgi:hypothetical protein